LTTPNGFLTIEAFVFQEISVIKLDIVNEVVNRTGITKTRAEVAVETVFNAMKKALAAGDRIELRGFGVFNVKPRKTGIGRNPRTGQEVNIPPGKAVRFKPGKELHSL
jgi:DNA-binding protein HU-beta